MPSRPAAGLVLGLCLLSIPAAAEEDPSSAQEAPAAAEKGTAAAQQSPPAAEKASAEPQEGWRTEATGYFRAPMALGLSSRPNPDNPTGPSSTQVSYGPNRTVDASYYSFAYTRLQEQDWAEVFIHEKKKHVDAAVGWMGYWYQSIGFRSPDAAWVPGMAYLTLDTDFTVGGFTPNIALTAGAWWPKFGYFAKYDTYTLGRFRQMGEQLKLTVPVNPDLTVTVVEGFGTGRDGSYNFGGVSPLYAATTGIDLVTYENVQVTYKKYVDVGLHYNNEWTADPNLTLQQTPGDKSYGVAQMAHLTTVGAEATVSLPYAGKLWMSPSYIHVRNGWALANAGTEVMHSLGGAGIAANYMAWTNTPSDSTGSGSMLNFGFLYENTLSGVQGKAPGSVPEVTLNVFGLLTSSSLDLPTGSKITQRSINQFKYGADVTVQPLDWLALTLRYDTVNLDMDNPAYIYSVITPRVAFSSHFLSGERIYVQYSRYIYGDKILLDGQWHWGTAPLVVGADVLQQGPYAGTKPDMDVVKLQADIAF